MSTQNKAVHYIHEPAPPTLFILGAISLPTFLRNGYFQADGRSVRKLEADSCRSYVVEASHHVQPFLFSALRQKHCGECVAVPRSSRRHRAGGVQRTKDLGPIRSISVITLGVGLASIVKPGISSVCCLKVVAVLLLKSARVIALT